MVTNEQLLAAINQISDRIDRFEERVDKRFDSIEERFDAMERRFDAQEGRLDRIESRLAVVYDERKEVTIKFSQAWAGASLAIAVIASGISLFGYGLLL